MRYALSFHDALQDSPKFRRDLAYAENNILSFEQKLEKLIQCNRSFQECGKHFINSFESLISQFSEMTNYFGRDNDEPVKQTLEETVYYMKSVKTLNENLLDCINRTIFKHGTFYLTNEIKPLHDNKKSFDKLSDDLDAALIKNSQIGRSKVLETEEIAKVIKALQSYFAHAVLDYVYHVNKYTQSKRLTVLNLVVSLLRGHKSYFDLGSSMTGVPTSNSQQHIANGLVSPLGNKTILDLDKMENLATESAKELNELAKDMEERHCLVKERELSLKSLKSLQENFNVNGKPYTAGTKMDQNAVNTTMEGYLFKRSTGKFKTWNRRWFAIRNNQLVYCKRMAAGPLGNPLGHPPLTATIKRNDFSSGSDSPKTNVRSQNSSLNGCDDLSQFGSYKIMERDLRLCSVKLVVDIDRRFCFEVISPSRCHLLQADTELLRQAWINALQAGISSAYNDHNYFDASSLENSLDGPSNLSTSNPHSRIFLNQLDDVGKYQNDKKRCSQVSSANVRESNRDLNVLLHEVTHKAVDLEHWSETNEQLSNRVNSNLTDTLIGALKLSNQSSLEPEEKTDKSLSVRDILEIGGNSLCCDCRAPAPEWASINLGITLCIECSGIHRSLGVHRSKVRSLYLDAWEGEHIKIMLALGNDSANEIYLGNVQSYPKNLASSFETDLSITAISTREEREAFIKAKYLDKRWVRTLHTTVGTAPLLNECPTPRNNQLISPIRHPSQGYVDTGVRSRISYFETSKSAAPPPLQPLEQEKCLSQVVTPKSFINQLWSPKYESDATVSSLMIEGLKEAQLKKIAWALALGQNLNAPLLAPSPSNDQIAAPQPQLDDQISNFKGATPLQIAASYGNSTAIEYLLLNGAKIDVKNALNGFTALHYATLNGLTRIVCQLIKRGTDISNKAYDGREALDLAIAQENADLVTLLRVGKLRLEAESFASDDMTFTEVMNDFSKMAPSG